VAIGAGYLVTAIFAATLVLLVLFVFMLLEGWIDRVSQIHVYKIVCQFENDSLHRYEDLFRSHHLKFHRSSQRKSAENLITGEWIVKGSERNHRHCIHEVLRDETVREFEF
jgi:putative Mg2+ transporter-C (MgtC) family protein